MRKAGDNLLVPGSARPTHISQPQDCSCHHFSGKWPLTLIWQWLHTLHILFTYTYTQHPKESRRPHQTAKMAAMGLANQKCQIHTRTKIKPDDPVLAEASSSSSVYVMFPNPKSTDVKGLAMAQLKQPLTISMSKTRNILNNEFFQDK